MGELRFEEPRAFSQRFWELVREGNDATDAQSVIMHAVQILHRLERGAGSEPAGQQFVAELYGILRRDAAQRYSPPELIAGQPMTQRSLVYAVGVALYERVTGDHPFGEQPDPDGSIDVDYARLPGQLVPVIRRALAARPEERFGNLAMMRLRLEEFVRGRSAPPADETPPPVARAPRSVISDIGSAPIRPAPRQIEREPEPEPEPEREAREDDVSFTAEQELLSTPPAPIVIQAIHHADAPPPERYHEAPLAAPPRGRWGWALGGAAVAAIVVWVALRKPAPQPEPHPAAPAVATAPATPSPAAPAPSPSTSPSPSAAPRFDPMLMGDTIATRARACFDDDQLATGMHFGFSVVVGLDGTVKRLYFPGQAELLDSEEQCLIRAATGVSAGGAPTRVTIVGYGLRLTKDHADVKIRSVR